MMDDLDRSERPEDAYSPPFPLGGPSASYVYRWASTHADHCSGRMWTPEDETWYALGRVDPEHLPHVGTITPQLDIETQHLYDLLRAHS